MTDFAHPRLTQGTTRLLYALAVAAALFEVAVVWLMLHPNVNADYRGYYIDQTSTCLNQPGVPGTYRLGEAVSFASDGAALAKPLRVCGWEGPAGDGTHAVGESSRLRFALGGVHGALRLRFDMIAIDHDGYRQQRVDVAANGVSIGQLVIPARAERLADLVIPAGLVGEDGLLDVVFSYPDAVLMSPRDSKSRKRSVKLQSLTLAAE